MHTTAEATGSDAAQLAALEDTDMDPPTESSAVEAVRNSLVPVYATTGMGTWPVVRAL